MTKQVHEYEHQIRVLCKLWQLTICDKKCTVSSTFITMCNYSSNILCMSHYESEIKTASITRTNSFNKHELIFIYLCDETVAI